MKLHIILRTCDRGNVHNDWRVRYCNFEKIDLVKGCFRSLVNSIKNTKKWIEVKLTILDDHSSDDLIKFLHKNAEGVDYELISLNEYGYNNSAFKQYEMCRDSDADLVYSIEDDYLHYESCIQEMVDSYFLFKEKIKEQNIVLYPFDAPEVYDPPEFTCFLVHGSNRHWRTGYFTTNVMMCSPDIFRDKDNWALFEKLAKEYNGNYIRKEEIKEGKVRVHESNTIWQIWGSGKALRFSPVPSLALHMQFDQQYDPFIDWRDWWDRFAKTPAPQGAEQPSQ